MTRHVLYDYLQVAGGAERLALMLSQALPGYQLWVSRIYPPARLLEEIRALQVHALGSPVTRGLGRIIEAIHCFKHRTEFLANAQSVIYSGVYAPLAVRNQRQGQRLYYCHTPPRYAYDWQDRYLARLPRYLRWTGEAILRWIRHEYEAALKCMNHVFANSENVRKRLARFTGINSTIIHPPVDTAALRWLGQEDYFVSIARLEPYKRVSTIVRAFTAMPDQRLIVLSGGSEETALRRIAAKSHNITLLGWQNDSTLRDIVGKARAAIYVPVDEDFGMSPVEAMAAGKPVIGVAEGGLLETVISGETGTLIEGELSVDALVEKVQWMTQARALAMRAACEHRAAMFSSDRFLSKIKRVIDG